MELKTILVNCQRRNEIASFELLDDNYAILMLNTGGGGASWTYNIVGITDCGNYSEVLVYANNLKKQYKESKKYYYTQKKRIIVG